MEKCTKMMEPTILAIGTMTNTKALENCISHRSSENKINIQDLEKENTLLAAGSYKLIMLVNSKKVNTMVKDN